MGERYSLHSQKLTEEYIRITSKKLWSCNFPTIPSMSIESTIKAIERRYELNNLSIRLCFRGKILFAQQIDVKPITT
jgi:hypothetical protein